jgi:hypothetical protein
VRFPERPSVTTFNSPVGLPATTCRSIRITRAAAVGAGRCGHLGQALRQVGSERFHSDVTDFEIIKRQCEGFHGTLRIRSQDITSLPRNPTSVSARARLITLGNRAGNVSHAAGRLMGNSISAIVARRMLEHGRLPQRNGNPRRPWPESATARDFCRCGSFSIAGHEL